MLEKCFALYDSMNEFLLQWLSSGLLPLAHAAIAEPGSLDAICATLHWSSRANVMSQNPSDSSGKCSLIDSSQSQLPIKCYDAAFHQGLCVDLLVARSPSSKLQQNCEKQEKNLKKGSDKKKKKKSLLTSTLINLCGN